MAQETLNYYFDIIMKVLQVFIIVIVIASKLLCMILNKDFENFLMGKKLNCDVFSLTLIYFDTVTIEKETFFATLKSKACLVVSSLRLVLRPCFQTFSEEERGVSL